jgi:hypothetical protein
MDLEALRTWHTQGLIDGDSPVRRSRSRSWVPLGTLPEFKGAARSTRTPGAKGRRPARESRAVEQEERGEPVSIDQWRLRGTGVLLLVVALALGLVAWRPHVAHPAFDGAPWTQMALATLGLALAVLPGWELSRRLVRVVLVLAAFALFPLAGILIAQGERGTALLALASSLLLILGFVTLLAPVLRWGGLLLGLLPILAGAYGLLSFGQAQDSEAAQAARSWRSGERRFTDDSVGLTLDLPAGWVVLKPGNPLVTGPEGTLVTIAQPRLEGYGYLLAEPAPRGVATPDQYLDHVMTRRRAEEPTLVEQGRETAILGNQTGRRLDATWTDEGVPQRDMTIAAQDGWMSFALVAWMPEAAASRRGGLDSLAEALHVRGLLAPRLDAAVQAAVEGVPHLQAGAAKLLMAQSEARVLEPDQAFRRSVVALADLLPSLSPAEVRELSGLTRATYASVPWKNRTRLARYIERVRKGDTTGPALDREMASLMKDAELRLSAEQRLRLQQFYDRAVREAGHSST